MDLSSRPGDLMGLVALLAVDFAVVPGITSVPNPLTRIGLFGCCRWCTCLPSISFCSGQGSGAKASRTPKRRVSPRWWRRSARPRTDRQRRTASPQLICGEHGALDQVENAVSDIYLFGMDGIIPRRPRDHYPAACYPVLLAGRARGYRLRLEKSDHRGGTPRRAFASRSRA